MSVRRKNLKPFVSIARQRGSFLLEAVAAIIFFAAIMMGYARLKINLAESEVNEAVGEQIKIIQSGVNSYVSEKRKILISSATPAVSGFANPMNPTMTELTNDTSGVSYIPPGYAPANVLGMLFTVNVTRVPNGCTPGTNCTDVTALITSGAPSGPLIDPGSGYVNVQRVGHLAQVVGADAAFSDKTSPSVLKGITGVWPISNPLGSVAGVLVMRAGYGSVGYMSLDYLMPRDGSKQFTGDINFGGNSILNVNNVTAAGNVTGSKFTPTALVNVGAPCTPVNATTVGTDGIYKYNVICRTGTWSISGPPFANANDACPTNGMYASGPSNGMLLVCRGNRFLPVSSLTPSSVERGSQVVSDGDIVVKPVCDTGGTATYKLVVVQTAVGYSASPPIESNVLSASSISSTQWQISYKVKDSVGNVFSATNYGLQGVIYTNCTYP